MSKFRFRITRNVTESCMVVVEANNLFNAFDAAINNPDPFMEDYWVQDDNAPNKPYIPDEEDYEIIDLTWNRRNPHPKYSPGRWLTAIRLYETELGYHDWVESKLGEEK